MYNKAVRETLERKQAAESYQKQIKSTQAKYLPLIEAEKQQVRGDPARLEKLKRFREVVISGTVSYYLKVTDIQLLYDEERGKYRPYNETAEVYYEYKLKESQIHLDLIKQGVASQERLQKLRDLESNCPVYYGLNDAGRWGFWYKSPENHTQDSREIQEPAGKKQSGLQPKEVKTPERVITRPRKGGEGETHTRSERGIACDVCGEQYSIAQVKNALETGRMKCSCENNLTKTAKTLIDQVEGD